MSEAARKAVKNVLASAALVVSSVALTLLLAEVGLRLASPTGYWIRQPNLSETFRPLPGVMPGISGESRFRTNSQGLRADELTPADAYRILAIGGSTTECLYLDQSETWPQLLQDTLNENPRKPRTWVGNAGMSGRNTRHHLMAMRYLPLDEMKINAVVLLMGINDLSIRLSQADAYNPAALQDPNEQTKLIEETFTGMQHGSPYDPWFKQTLLWQRLRTLKTMLAGKPQSQPVQQDAAGDVYIDWRRNRQQAGAIIDQLPDLTSGVDEYTNNIKEIAKIARANSVRLILMTQPTMWRPDLPQELASLLWFGGIGEFQTRIGQPYYSVAALANGINQYNEALLKVCASERLECIDLSHLTKDTSVFYDDVHFNEAGAKTVANILRTYIDSRAPYRRDQAASQTVNE